MANFDKVFDRLTLQEKRGINAIVSQVIPETIQVTFTYFSLECSDEFDLLFAKLTINYNGDTFTVELEVEKDCNFFTALVQCTSYHLEVNKAYIEKMVRLGGYGAREGSLALEGAEMPKDAKIVPVQGGATALLNWEMRLMEATRLVVAIRKETGATIDDICSAIAYTTNIHPQN
jgi:hypothetical protein